MSPSEYWGLQILFAVLLFWPFLYSAIFTFIYKSRTNRIKTLFFSVVLIAYGIEGLFVSVFGIIELMKNALISANVDNILSRSVYTLDEYNIFIIIPLSLIVAFFVSRYFTLSILSEQKIKAC